MLSTLRETAGDREKKVNGQAQQEGQKVRNSVILFLQRRRPFTGFFSDKVVVGVFENMEKHKY